MTKVRLVKGPFAGKVTEVSGMAGQSRLVMSGPKRMSRKERHQWLVKSSTSYGLEPRPPQVRCQYEIAMTGFNGQLIPCTHPDGSYFYTYVEGSKKEY